VNCVALDFRGPQQNSSFSCVNLPQIGNTERPPRIPQELSPCLQDVARRCFDLDPTRRPSAADLLGHEAFASTISQQESDCCQQPVDSCDVTDVCCMLEYISVQMSDF
jgi:serine/threonine protein kinase